jgi:hypothetical protein
MQQIARYFQIPFSLKHRVLYADRIAQEGMLELTVLPRVLLHAKPCM